MKVKDKNLSEKEIDQLVTAQANDDNAWTNFTQFKTEPHAAVVRNFSKR